MFASPYYWWVQSVMPVVFDNSLSYYEVLAKLTQYVEGLIGDVDKIEKILGTIEGIEDVTDFMTFLQTIQNEIGNLGNLNTQNKSDLVSAINEIAQDANNKIGNLNNLPTRDKDNLVDALTEVYTRAQNGYILPFGGIPESDLSQDVQNKLNSGSGGGGGGTTNVDYIINNVTLKKSPNNNTLAELGIGTYTVPEGGIPESTLSDAVRAKLNSGGGGGGGTYDYTALDNKPQINGHTLNAGNNSASTLGLGTYSKPSGGIPESDLSNEVAAKLNRAYVMPATGIPESDLSDAVKEKLNTSGGIADENNGFVARRTYESGELVYINGVLYKVTRKTLAGSNFVVGNNIIETDINDELASINEKIDKMESGQGLDSWNLNQELTILDGGQSTPWIQFFYEFNGIQGENYLLTFTPRLDKLDFLTAEYTFRIHKHDGTVVEQHQIARADSINVQRFNFAPAVTDSYYMDIKCMQSSTTKLYLIATLEYTMSQGISELWYQVNQSASLEPRVEAVEGLVEQQQGEITELSSDIENLNNSVNYLSETLNAGYKIIEGHYVDGDGKIVPGAQYNLSCFKVESDGVIEELRSTDVIIYAFYSDEPQIGSVSYNQSRYVSNNAFVLNNIAVPDSVTWIAVRGLVANNTVITIDPKSSVIRNIENKSIFNEGTYNDNINNVKDNSMRYVPASNTSSPLYNLSSGELHTFELVTGAYMQLFYALTGTYKGKRYTRAYINNAWNDWINYDVNESELNKFLKWYGAYTGDINNVKDNSIRYISSSIDNSPFNGVSACVLITTEAAAQTFMQTAIGFSASYKGIRYTRTFVQNAWTGWVSYDNGKFLSNPIYHAFGDSVMYGAKWVSAEGSPGYQIVRTAEINRIPTRIANAIGAERNFYNNGVSGAALAGQGDNRIINKIRATDMTGVKLITVGGGRNDSSNQLGDIESVIDDGTICGAVREIIEYLQANYPKAQIVWIGVTPHGDADNHVFTWETPAGWTLNSFDEAVSAVCAEYCVPYVNWKKCSYMMNWSTFSAVAGNYVHPDNDESYLQMGNYIAGQVANYYRG